jgi:hypothetical protein
MGYRHLDHLHLNQFQVVCANQESLIRTLYPMS